MTVMCTPVEHSNFDFWSPHCHTTEVTREQGRSSGESARLPPMWSEFDSGLVPHVGWVCWLFSPCSEGFSPGFPVFLPPQRPTSPNSNSTRMEDPHENQLRLMWLPRLINIVIFIYSSVTPRYLFRFGSKWHIKIFIVTHFLILTIYSSLLV